MRNNYQFEKLQSVTNSTEFYQWCRGYFKDTLLQANLYAVLEGAFGSYVVKALKSPPAFLPGHPTDVCIELKSNEPSLDKRRWSLKKDSLLRGIDLSVRRLPFYELTIRVSIKFSKREQFREFKLHFEDRDRLVDFLTQSRPIDWSSNE